MSGPNIEPNIGHNTLTNLLFSSATASMGGAALLNVICAVTQSGRWKRSNALSAAVNIIAFIHYYYMRSQRGGVAGTNMVAVRYSDWLITTPLMLLEFASILKQTGEFEVNGTLWGALVSNFFMLWCGYTAEQVRRGELNAFNGRWKGLWAMGTFGLLGVYSFMGKYYDDNKNGSNDESEEDVRREKKTALAFLSLWACYGVAFHFPAGNPRENAYNSLDILSKAVLGAYVGIMSMEKSSVPVVKCVS